MTGSSKTPAVAFLTLGCPKNEVDTDRMRAAVAASAYELAEDLDAADVLVVNTCSFIEAATDESIQTVLAAASDWVPEGTQRKIVVAGCMPSRYGEELAEAMPEVAAFVPVDQEQALIAVLERLTGARGDAAFGGDAPARTSDGPSAYLMIADGCHRNCTFCTIPSIRGPYASRPIAEIVAEAAELVAGGAREIVLIGQDITSYGHDFAGSETLADVVEAVAAVEGVAWLRLMYVQPDGVTDELLAAMVRHKNVCHYLDIPLQHASRRVLRAMGRSGDAEAFLALLARVRSAMPDVTLRTTLISGFPGETREDAQELQHFVEQAGFDYLGVFAYSAEDGTPAATMEAQIPVRTRLARTQRLRDLGDRIGFDKAAARVGEMLEVLVEGIEPEDGQVFGRWRGQAPEVDGIVLLDEGTPGEIVSACVVDALGYDLEVEVIR